MKKFILHQHVLGRKGRLDRAQAERSAREVAVLLENSGPNLGIALYVGGYDDTDLELFDIPEACRFLVWVGEALARRKVDFARLMPESLELIKACQARQQGHPIILREHSMAEFWDDFHTWEQYLRQKVH